MSYKNTILLVLAGVVAFLAIVAVIMNFSYKNSEIGLRNQAKAQQEANKVIFDKVWKVIQQKAQITDKYASDFKEIYGGIMHERYQGDAKQSPMFKWITEHNPTFSVELYKDLADAVEANRAEFARVQNRLIDIKREHDNLRQKFPSSIFVGDKSELDIQIVTSDKTTQVFQTGKENEVDLFKK
jgi:hypothetical protein